MNKFIVITSINNPTQAVKSFSRVKGYKVIVVGDKKSPVNWKCENVQYISVEEQGCLGFELSKVLPYNHYCRKMLGYLLAIKEGAEFIVDTDDDNIPKSEWSFPDFEGSFDSITKNKGFVNIYQLYTEMRIWPRGLPLNLVSTNFELNKSLERTVCKVGIWQGLADEDADVDAIYRLTSDEPCYFKERSPVVLKKGAISPFNSQNTIIVKELFPLMYLPTCVTFRFTDILRGLVAQPIMWLYGYELGFTNATVVQKRNPHDYMNDFNSEIPMYMYCEEVIENVGSAIHSDNTISENLLLAYQGLQKLGIVEKKELTTLKFWLHDVNRL